MRKMLKASSLLICAMLLFSACASSLNLGPGPFRSEMQDVFVQQTTLTVPASHAEHGEDYVIEWQDPVMEKHVRKWLDRPKGDIYHSDVWDYQRVSINSGTGVGDLIVKDAPDGVDIGRNVNSNEQLAACAVSVEGTYDPVTSLADLRHFDSLQVLSVNNRRGAPPITDLTGLEECKNLMLLSVPSVESSAFPTFAKLDSVVELKYGSDGIRADSNVSDLSALAQMKSLKMLWITGSEVDLTQLAGADLRVLRLDVTRIGSLEPLKQMENLSFLQLCQGPEIDSFAPLAESSVQYLSMSLSQGAQEAYKDMDYTPLTQMPQLIWLDLTNNITFDTETCKKTAGKRYGPEISENFLYISGQRCRRAGYSAPERVHCPGSVMPQNAKHPCQRRHGCFSMQIQSRWGIRLSLRSSAVMAVSSAMASRMPSNTSMQLCCLSRTVDAMMETQSTAEAGRIQRRPGVSKMRLR